jgi:nickel transport protein
MRPAALALVLVFVLDGAAIPVRAHEVLHEVARGEAVVVALRYAAGSPFAYEQYEVLPPNSATPFQIGRCDAAGRIVFLPDRPGEWRLKASSEDGHGIDLTVTVDATGAAAAKPRSLWERGSRLVTGIALLFGIFGLFMLFARRR